MVFFFFKQKTAYEMRISDWSSDVCSSDLRGHVFELAKPLPDGFPPEDLEHEDIGDSVLFYVAAPEDMLRRLPPDATHLHRAANLEDVFLRLTGRRLREG